MSAMVLLSSLMLSFAIIMPLSAKWQLERRVTVPAAASIGLFAGTVSSWVGRSQDLGRLHLLALEIVLIAATSLSLLLWRFYRDPDRIPPQDENAVLSPADGKIIYIKTIEDGRIPCCEKKGTKFALNDFLQTDVLKSGGYLIGISMNFLDVHVNRAPIAGKVALLKHIKGAYMSLRKREAILQNERVLSVIENDRFRVGVVQIASRLVRRIVPYFHEGDEVQRGQRIGAIRFGSQVDLVLPSHSSLRIEVTPGQNVNAGISVIATLHEK